jgi:pimeloyl-ACP methyl ester carboxylesterase
MEVMPLRAPSGLQSLNELRFGVDLLGLVAGAPMLARCPRGSGEPVIVIPGFGGGDGSTMLLRRFLGSLGYSVRSWGLGVNRGNVEDLMPRVNETVRDTARDTGEPVKLVGWSLGGVLAREAAREEPTAVGQVVTLGSPVIGGPRYTATARFYENSGVDLAAIEAEVEARNRVPIEAPITAIYSKNDGVVCWRACLDTFSPNARNIEVSASHIGLGFSAEVLRTIAAVLARPD